MQREIRYTVLKHKDIESADLTGDELETLKEICAKVEKARAARGKGPIECVVVESDWPEYLDTWAAIARRVDGVPLYQARMQQFHDYEKKRS